MSGLLSLSKSCFKIDKLNATAMIFGYPKNGNRIHQAIYCKAIKKDPLPIPELITIGKHPLPNKFKRSNIGQRLESESESLTIRMKYIVELDDIYHIENDIILYETICNNGLFDIWHPEAPFDMFYTSKNVEKNPLTYCKILLLRIHEIDYEFKEDDLCRDSDTNDCLVGSDRTNCILGKDKTVLVKNPVISDTEFNKIKLLLEDSIKDYQLS